MLRSTWTAGSDRNESAPAGNRTAFCADHIDVGCERWREPLSAWIDDEACPDEDRSVEVHLGECEPCARWADDAVALTRALRIRVAQTPSRSAIPERVLAAAPGRRLYRVARALRFCLGTLGLGQFVLGIAQLGGLSPWLDHGQDSVPAAHLSHESAAWNIAVGACFAWIVLHRARPATQLPVLTCFVGLLTLVGVNDALVGQVGLDRLVTHTMVFTGYLIVVALSRPTLDFGEQPPGTSDAVGSSRHFVRSAAEGGGLPTPTQQTPIHPHCPMPATKSDLAA